MQNRTQGSTLADYLDSINKNFQSLNSAFPQTYSAAEALNGLIDQLYTYRIVPNQSWEKIAHVMLFGCLSSWQHTYITSAAGFGEHARTSLRRAIEFACYISKIRGKNDRAELWANKRKDETAKKEFTRTFSVPQCYFNQNKYRHLKPLLVLHDYASDFGVHANSAMFVDKWRDNSLSLHDDPLAVPRSMYFCVQTGAIILEALLVDLEKQIQGSEDFSGQVINFKALLKKAWIEKTNFDESRAINSESDIVEFDPFGIFDEEFEELKKAYSKHLQTSCNVE